MPSDATNDYERAYTTLKQNAERLQADRDIGIDDLMDLVEQSIAAYKICQSRIDAVELAVQEAFDRVQNPHNDQSK